MQGSNVDLSILASYCEARLCRLRFQTVFGSFFVKKLPKLAKVRFRKALENIKFPQGSMPQNARKSSKSRPQTLPNRALEPPKSNLERSKTPF